MNVIELKDYTIYDGDVGSSFATFIKDRNYSKIVCLADSNTVSLCLPILEKEIDRRLDHILIATAGERNKTVDSCKKIWKQMYDAQLDRKVLVINLGGGVIGDMGGFCAATYKRGVDFVQMPTTLLSMVDSSIGGKLGVDFYGGKNIIGVFANPRAVFIDTVFLKTLKDRHLKNGFAETIKHALIADKSLWTDVLAESISIELVTKTLVSSLLVKKKVVEQDPYEDNIRKSLNFGHTLGHAIESYYLERSFDLMHGEAVVLGMIAEAYLSHHKVGLPKNEFEEIVRYLTSEYDSLTVVQFNMDEIYSYVINDKKNERNKINCTLLPAVGESQINVGIDYEDIKMALSFLMSCYE